MRPTSRSKKGSLLHPAPGEMSRRTALRSLGVGVAAIPIVGCSSMVSMLPEDAGPLPRDATPETDAAEAMSDAAAASDAAATADASGDDAAVVVGWASGGTAAMTGSASYPDPFEGGGASCALTVGATLGPCFYTSPVRRDVSEGYPGLPVRLALRVVDRSCAPIANARVEIWHTRNTGLYSGGPVTLCTTGDADAIAHLYFRGGQVTDADGQVGFDTCFPGWYAGRAIHIHFQVFLEGGASATSISQVFFPTSLNTEIFDSHPDYEAFGQPDRSNESDSIYGGIGASGLVEYERMSDGAMLAWKQIVVR